MKTYYQGIRLKKNTIIRFKSLGFFETREECFKEIQAYHLKNLNQVNGKDLIIMEIDFNDIY